MFIHGFAKSAVENVRDDELILLKYAAVQIFAMNDTAIATVLNEKTWIEVEYDE